MIKNLKLIFPGILKILVIFYVMSLLQSCAHIVAPGGGPKDTQAPKAIKFSPENFSVYFKAKQTLIEFDEYIDFKNLSEQLIISPPLDVQPEIKIKKKTIDINFSKSNLKDSTTYTINFGNAVADVNEGNAIQNFQYVFSTGSYLDSMKLKGNIVDASSMNAIKDVVVLVYHRKNDDSLPYKNRPDYFTKTLADGKFEIKNIPPGKNKIFALKDGNADYLYNQAGESIAFEDSMIDPIQNKEIQLQMFTELSGKQLLMRVSSPEYGRYVFVFKRPAKEMDLKILEQNQGKKAWDIKEYTSNKDTIILWSTSKHNDTLTVKLQDRDGLLGDTLLSIPVYNQDASIKSRSRNKNKLIVNFKSIKSEIQPYFEPLTLECSHPLINYDSDKIILMEDTVEIKKFQISYLDSVRRKLVLNYKWKEKKNYQLKILPSAFTDIFGLLNDTILGKFKTSESTQYGSINLVAEIDSVKKTQYVISLISDKGAELWVKEIYENKSFVIDHLEPGKYRLKAIEDVNGNGIWDTGNYLKKLQPEKVLFYASPIQIRSNWDVETKWRLKF